MTVFLKRQIARSLWNIRNRILVHGWKHAPISTDRIFYKKTNNMLRIDSGKFYFINFMSTEIEITKEFTFTLGDSVYNGVNVKDSKEVFLCYSGKYIIPIEKNQPILYPLVSEAFREMREFIKEIERE